MAAYIHEALPQRLPFKQESLGEQEVKGFAEPIRVYSVRPQEDAQLPEPAKASQPRVAPTTRWVILVASIVLICAGGLLAWYQPWAPEIETASVERMAYPLPDKPSIAVLAFDNLSREPDAERFSDGISENIITVLSKIPELFVIARNSSFTYKGKAVPPRRVAEDFGVRYVLEGSLQKEGDKIRVTAQLIDALDGSHLWAETYDRRLDDFFAVQDEITLNVVKSLQSKLVLGETWSPPKRSIDNIQTWELYTKAWWHFRKTTKEDNIKARALAQKVIELDPGLSGAHSLLGWTHVRDAQLRWSEDSKRSVQLAEEFANRALVLDDTNALAYTLLGRIYGLEQRYDDAIAVQEHALEFGPNDPSTWAALALTKLYAGYPKDAIVLSKKVERLYPTMPPSWLGVQNMGHYLLGEYEDALSVASRQLQRQPERTNARLIAIASHTALGQTEQAQAEVEYVLEHAPNFSVHKWADKFITPFKDKSIKEPFVQRLLQAGMPE